MNKLKKSAAGIFWGSGAGPFFRLFFEPEFLTMAYHSVSGEGAKPHLEIQANVFRKQMEYLKNRKYSFRQFKEGGECRGKSAFVYFDDGFKSVQKNAYPILKELKIPFTLFLTTDYLDQKKEAGLYMTWDEARSMADLAEFGSHSISHKKLNKIPRDEAKQEMVESKRIIEKRLGVLVTSFSYPYMRFSGELERVAREVGYMITTASKKFRKARPDPDDSFAVFKMKTGLEWF